MEKIIQFESFNARYLSYEQVADVFIPNQAFRELLAVNHSVILGPRGCGKTTLLKMLNLSAFTRFKRVKGFTEEIPFLAIYIPTDKQWESQILHMYKIFGDNYVTPELISSILVSLNILIATCN